MDPRHNIPEFNPEASVASLIYSRKGDVERRSVLDLHKMTPSQAEEVLKFFIEKKPFAKTLNVITGQGKHSLGQYCVIREITLRVAQKMGYRTVETDGRVAIRNCCPRPLLEVPQWQGAPVSLGRVSCRRRPHRSAG